MGRSWERPGRGEPLDVRPGAAGARDDARSALGPELYAVLKAQFGFLTLRPGQAEILAAILQGRHVLGVMPTGAGKSLCYQLPAVARGGLTLVVSPLVALMDAQVADLRLSGIAADALHSGRAWTENRAAWDRAATGRTRLLYLAPERLMQPDMLRRLQELDVTLIAIDEAHCISRWGPTFRPDYEALAQLGVHFPHVPIAAFTATADRATRQDIRDRLFAGQGQEFCFGFDRPNIRLAVQERRRGQAQLLRFVQARQGQSGIVYCLSRRNAETTAAFLNANGVTALPYHAGMSAQDRMEHQQLFMTRTGLVMAATIAFGMGIDKPDIRYVFHARLPANMEGYYQEIGRAGRDGAAAEALMLYGLDDIVQRRRFIAETDSAEEYRRREYQRLELLIGYCEGAQCRRQALLGAFDERLDQPCGNCDNCQQPPELANGLIEGQKALSAAYRTGQRFGASHLVDILTGQTTLKVRQNAHDQLPTFGVGRDRSPPEWRSIIRQLVAAGHLAVDIGAMGSLAITPRGRRLLAGKEDFVYRRAPRPPARRPALSARDEAVPRGRATPSLFEPSPAERARATGNDARDAQEQRLFERLREVRLALARARRVPAYVIFHDRTLLEMARHQPRTLDELLAVPGVGQAKLQAFGQVFTEAIAAHAQQAPEPI